MKRAVRLSSNYCKEKTHSPALKNTKLRAVQKSADLSITNSTLDSRRFLFFEKYCWSRCRQCLVFGMDDTTKRVALPCVALKGEPPMHEVVAQMLNSDPSKQYRVLSMTVASPVLERKPALSNDRLWLYFFFSFFFLCWFPRCGPRTLVLAL
jgi:hypothetical protein